MPFITNFGGFPGGGGAVGPLAAWGDDSVGNSPTVRYLTPWVGPGLSQTVPIQWASPGSGKARRLYVRHNVLGGNANRIVYTLRVNGVATALSVAVAANAVGGADLANEVDVAQGDRLDLEITKPDGPVGSSPRDVMATLDFG